MSDPELNCCHSCSISLGTVIGAEEFLFMSAWQQNILQTTTKRSKCSFWLLSWKNVNKPINVDSAIIDTMAY